MNTSALRLIGSVFSHSVIALVIATLAVCATSVATAETPAGLGENYLFATTSEYDFSAGNFDLVNVTPPWTSFTNQGAICADNSLRYYNGLIYLINRVGCDNIQIIDPDFGFATIGQFSTGNLSNPADICFVNETRAFITRYDTDELWEVDPQSGVQTDIIDLSPFADGDGIPEMFAMAIHNGRLYVTIQRLDRNNYWNPAGGSCLAVIDLTDNSIIDMDLETPGLQGIALSAQNPNCWIHIDPTTGYFQIAELGFYGVNDGGIEIIDPQTEESLGFAITEETLGGDINEWDSASDGIGFACVLSPTWTPSIVAFDLQSGVNRGTLVASSEYAYRSLVVDETRRQLIFADRTYADPGILIYNIDQLNQLTDGPIATGLYPNSLLVIEGPATGIEPTPALSYHHLTLWPQPARERLQIRYQSPHSNQIRVDIVDITGRQIVQLASELQVNGEAVITWDGTNQRGQSVPAGAYFTRVTTPTERVVKKLQWVR